MNFLEGLLLALLIFPATCLAGYSVAGLLVTPTAGVRLCIAALAGLGIWLWLVACVNVFSPINFWVAWSIIGTGWLGALLLPFARRALLSDIRMLRSSGGNWCILAPLPLLAGMLLPALVHPDLVFYDGTSNHDSFFWITGAEWLQQHPYLISPHPGVDPAVYNVSGAITGTTPAWGRMGTEGLLALLASAMKVLPIDVYVYTQAGALSLWLASMVVFVRLVLVQRISFWMFIIGASFQPVFVFFITNNSTPNLWGALVAPVMLVAFVRLTETGLTRRELMGWGGVAALMLHGLLCTYPEMAPFALFAAGSAAGAKIFRSDRQGRRLALSAAVILAGATGLLIQPLSTWRAYGGFWNSFHIARTTTIWGNFFDTLDFSAYVPALVTLNAPACKFLGPGLGWLVSVLLVLMLCQVVRLAHDRATAIAGLSGFFILIGYTLATDFSYGWQKAVQFCGVIVAGYFSFGSFLILNPKKDWRTSILRHAAVTIIAGLMAYTTVWGCARGYYWAGLKGLDRSFVALRDLSRGELRNQPVEVVGASFERPFFYTMWAVYALPQSSVAFDQRGGQRGGYLQDYLPQMDTSSPEAIKPGAYLVSRAWADTFDADSVRLSSGVQHALLVQTNKVVAQTGISPLSGVPESARAQFSLTLLPYADGVFAMDIEVSPPDRVASPELNVSYGNPDQTDSWQTIRVEYPWHMRVPVRGGAKCQIKVAATFSSQAEYPLRLNRLRLTQKDERSPQTAVQRDP